MPIRWKGVVISYAVGLPAGLGFVLIVMAGPLLLTGEGLLSYILYQLHGPAIVALIVTFIAALGLAGHRAWVQLEQNTKILAVSFQYALLVNGLIWGGFNAVQAFITGGQLHWLHVLLPFVAAAACILITTFTIGLLICFIMRSSLLSSTGNRPA